MKWMRHPASILIAFATFFFTGLPSGAARYPRTPQAESRWVLYARFPGADILARHGVEPLSGNRAGGDTLVSWVRRPRPGSPARHISRSMAVETFNISYRSRVSDIGATVDSSFTTTASTGSDIVQDATPAQLQAISDEPYACAVYYESIPGRKPELRPPPISVTHEEAARYYRVLKRFNGIRPWAQGPLRTWIQIGVKYDKLSKP